MSYMIYRWFALLMLTVFLLLLPRLTKPRPQDNPDRNSTGWLTVQMMAAGLCAAVSGLLTISALWVNLTGSETSDWHIKLVESTPVAA